MSFLKFLWAKHPFASVAFALALGGLVVFGSGFVRDTLYFNDPAHRNQDLEPWMTPRYVGMSWDLPPEVLGPLMGLSKDMPRDGRPPRLDEIAARMGITIEELQARVLAAKVALDPGFQPRASGVEQK